MNKQTWLNLAEIIDAIRLVPRALLAALFVFYGWYIEHVTTWYFGYLEFMIQSQAFSVEAIAGSTAFITSTITALGGMVMWFAGNVYMKTGRAWGDVQKEDIHKMQSVINKYNGTE